MKQLKELSKDQLVKRIESSNVVAQRAREKTTRALEKLSTVAVSGAAAFGVAFLDAKLAKSPGDGLNVGPFPLPVVIGAGLVGVGLSGMGGKASEYALSAGIGALTAAAAMEGQKAGLKSRTGFDQKMMPGVV